MAKLVLTLAGLCIFYAVSANVIDNDVLKPFLGGLNKCKDEVDADDDNVRELMNYSDNYTMKAKCLFACILKRIEIVDDNGKLMEDAALLYAKKNMDGDPQLLEISKQIIDACANIEVDDNPCESAIQYGKCFAEQVQANNISCE